MIQSGLWIRKVHVYQTGEILLSTDTRSPAEAVAYHWEMATVPVEHNESKLRTDQYNNNAVVECIPVNVKQFCTFIFILIVQYAGLLALRTSQSDYVVVSNMKTIEGKVVMLGSQGKHSNKTA